MLCLICVFTVGITMGISGYSAGKYLLKIYNPDPEVIKAGLIRMSVIFPTYFLCGLMDVLSGSVRGLGSSVTPMVVTIIGACGLRIVWIYTYFAVNRSLFVLYLSYPLSWTATAAVLLVCFFVKWRKLKKEGAT